MFYRPKDGHNLPHNPFGAIVSPRPIGWISTRSRSGIDNLAPYSFFNAIAYRPAQVMFASTGVKPERSNTHHDDTKDNVENIRQTGVFCVNIVEYAMRDKMNATSESFSAEIDEFDAADIEKAPCQEIDCARVATSPASLECRKTHIQQLEGANNFVVFGEVVGIHIRENCLKDGRFDISSFGMLSRLGYRDYANVTESFELGRPGE